MDKYKEKLKSIAFSPPIYDKMMEIGKTHNLTIDQVGELSVAIRGVILEVIPSADFIKEVANRLEINLSDAEDISRDVDRLIFKSIKSLVQQLMEVDQVVNAPAPTPTQAPKPPIAPIEKAGDFQVIKPDPSHSPLYNDHTLTKEDVLADLENIKKLQPKEAETYVEHLLETPVVQTPVVEKKVVAPPPVQPPPEQPPAPKPDQKKYTTDPYREAI